MWPCWNFHCPITRSFWGRRGFTNLTIMSIDSSVCNRDPNKLPGGFIYDVNPSCPLRLRAYPFADYSGSQQRFQEALAAWEDLPKGGSGDERLERPELWQCTCKAQVIVLYMAIQEASRNGGELPPGGTFTFWTLTVPQVA